MDLPLPPVGLNTAFLPFAVVALVMVAVTVFVLGKILPADHHPPLVTQMLLALSVMGGGTILLLSLVFVFINPNGTTAWETVLLAFNFMMTVPAGLWFIAVILFRDRRIDPNGWLWPVTLAVVATGSEVLMGFLFAVGAPAVTPPLIEAVAAGFASVWFFWSMAAVMTALLVWAPLSEVEKTGLIALTLAMALAPWVTTYPTVGGLAMAVLMTLVFVVLLRYLLRQRLSRSELGLLFGLAGAFLSMALAGLFLVTDGGAVLSTITFGVVMGSVMVVEISYLIRRFYRGFEGRPWVPRPLEQIPTAEPAVRPGVDPRSTDAGVAVR
ncbi:MAG TPA: hypothetical protein VEH57_09170 [Thermoplasmata archaeon]|nr:hypothetical protein [Thermoplasmata archaeon]